MRSKTTAIIFAWLLWPILDFYMGRPGVGVVKLMTLGELGIRALADAIRIPTMSHADCDFRYNYY